MDIEMIRSGALAQRTHQAADKLAAADATFAEKSVFGGTDEMEVQENVGHRTDLTTGTTRKVIKLVFLRDVKAFPSFGDIVHDRNRCTAKLVAKPEIP
jgi:hypothetical protein